MGPLLPSLGHTCVRFMSILSPGFGDSLYQWQNLRGRPWKVDEEITGGCNGSIQGLSKCVYNPTFPTVWPSSLTYPSRILLWESPDSEQDSSSPFLCN
jgi:hypothetical protein